jgi:hypothetical protein
MNKYNIKKINPYIDIQGSQFDYKEIIWCTKYEDYLYKIGRWINNNQYGINLLIKPK